MLGNYIPFIYKEEKLEIFFTKTALQMKYHSFKALNEELNI